MGRSLQDRRKTRGNDPDCRQPKGDQHENPPVRPDRGVNRQRRLGHQPQPAAVHPGRHLALTPGRIAILGASAAWRTEHAIARAANHLGLTAKVFDAPRFSRRLGGLGRSLVARNLARFAPDLIICTRHAWRLGPSRLRDLFRDRRSVLWYFDPKPHPGVIELGRLCDAMFITYAGQVEQWQQRTGRPVHFLPQGVDPDIDHPGLPRPELSCDVSFVGSGQYPFRWPILQRIAAGHDLQVRGPGWELAPEDIPVRGGEIRGSGFNDVVTSAKVSLGANAMPEQARDHASASNRMWKLLGTGAAYLGPWVSGIDRWARDREHCRWYRDPDEALAILDELLSDDAERMEMARRGREYALAHHCYHHRLELLIQGKGYDPGD